MSIAIVEANIETDLEKMRATLNANRTRQATAERFRWLYLANPDGRARAWLAVDEATGETAGFTAVFPRRVRPAGASAPAIAWNCGDFSIHQKFRAGGVAVKLRRAARDGVDRGDSPFLYAHPNDRMLPVHMRVGHHALAQMVRYGKVLRTSTGMKVMDDLSSGMLRFAGTDVLVRRRGKAELADSWPTPQELDDLDERVRLKIGTALVRDAAYLSWRFRKNPFEPVELLVAHQKGRLSGYLTFVAKDGSCSVKDWLAEAHGDRDALFASLLHELRRRRVARVSVIALETHPDLPRLRQFGFARRPDTSTAVVYAAEGYPARGAVLDPAAWYMTVGDRDV
jgi:hypothetical protein